MDPLLSPGLHTALPTDDYLLSLVLGNPSLVTQRLQQKNKKQKQTLSTPAASWAPPKPPHFLVDSDIDQFPLMFSPKSFLVQRI
jgi:hypothetical protein